MARSVKGSISGSAPWIRSWSESSFKSVQVETISLSRVFRWKRSRRKALSFHPLLSTARRSLSLEHDLTIL